MMAEVVRRDRTVTRSEGAARGYKWADATPRNTLAVRHGAGSESLVSAKADAVLQELMDEYPWLIEADGVIVDVFVRAKVRFNVLSDYIDDILNGRREAYPRKGYPTTGVEAVPDRVWQQVSREARTILDVGAQLGLSPLSRATLMKDTSLARHFAEQDLAG